jgi:cbb3-type cytochrome oxidase cytochrome c subunit
MRDGIENEPGKRKYSYIMKRNILIGAGVIIFVVVAVITYQMAPDGAAVFAREGCPNCHSFKGHGAGSGPDLTSVAERRSDRWIRRQIKNPRSHDPDSRMPAYDHLSRREIEALIQHLKS